MLRTTTDPLFVFKIESQQLSTEVSLLQHLDNSWKTGLRSQKCFTAIISRALHALVKVNPFLEGGGWIEADGSWSSQVTVVEACDLESALWLKKV